MPVKSCVNKDGIKGHSWGNGPCITGKDSKKKAIKVGLRIMYDKYGDKGGKEFQKEIKQTKQTKGEKTDINIEEDLYSLLSDLNTTEEEVGAIANILDLSLNQRMNLSINRKISKKTLNKEN